ncbi:hypothetical protein [Paractinoplanes durhamensis]|nr:hypothetical protein [Actinoplanes durhamensis]
MTVDKMQELIQNPNTDGQWDLVTGWKRSAELINEHRFQVESYRDNLAAAWPPAKSKAADEYITRLNLMIDNLKATYEASLANYDAVSRATGSIYQAQVEMEKIYKEYKANESLLVDFNAKQQQAQSSNTPTPTPSPSGEEPPVAPGRQEELRIKAVTMLSGVSTDLAQSQIKLVKPPDFKALKIVEDPSKPGDGSTYVAPPLPPITPIGAGGSSSTTSNSTRPSATFPTSPVATNPTPVTQPGLGTQQPGLVLGGTQPLAPTPVTPVGSGPISPSIPTGTGPFTNTGVLPASNPLLPSGGGKPLLPTPSTGAGRIGGLPREGLIRPGSLPEGTRAMPPGGLIGGTPGVGAGHSQPGRTGGASTRRINPVGGVIGEAEGASGARRGLGGASSVAGERPMGGGPYGQGSGRRSGRREDATDTRWDPDNPWETAEGVDPVVLPARDQHIDPGPAIGLH